MTRILIRGAMAAVLWLAATIPALGNACIPWRHNIIMTIIPFAESSAELTFDAIKILSNLAREIRLEGADGDVIYLDGDLAPEPVTRMRLTQIRDLLIDLGVPPGQLVTSAAPLCYQTFISVRAANIHPPAPAVEPESHVQRPE